MAPTRTSIRVKRLRIKSDRKCQNNDNLVSQLDFVVFVRSDTLNHPFEVKSAERSYNHHENQAYPANVFNSTHLS